jgi:uncharacterized protein YidB (DUF937 family)
MVVGLESMALSLAKTIVQKAAGAWIADRRTAEERKKELGELLAPQFRRAAPAQRFLDEAASELASFGRYEFRGLDDGDRAAALLAVRDAFENADLTDRALFAVDVDAAKLASRLRAGQPRAKAAAWLGEVGGAFYDAALDRCCELYVRAVVQVPAFVGRSLAEMLNRLSDLPDQVAARVVNALSEAQAAAADRPDSDVTVAGWALGEVTDPFLLEVHRPVQLEGAPGLPVLPLYEKREHDQVLRQVVRAAADGRSGIAVLVGESSTGKTRACWEALALLRDQDPPWRLWHPIDPAPPDAALRELPGIEPRTVVWLNEAQHYLLTSDERGERVAAGLRKLLRDVARGPVLVLATVWPEYWAPLTARPASGDDRHAQARELLAGHDMTVPAKFTPAQLSQLIQAADPRLVLAARSVPDGEVIQFLAGVPELLARYRNARPAARALIDAAMDARRLGMGVGLLQAFLKAAAPGYLTDAEWDALGKDWLEQALRYAAEDAKGVRGPLTCIRPRAATRTPRTYGDQPGSMAVAAGPLYRLADYLDQYGRVNRARQVPPAEFWSAAAAYAAVGDQAVLGTAAAARGLYRDAAQLRKNATAVGNIDAALYLIGVPASLNAVFHFSVIPAGLFTDRRPAQWAAAHAVLDDPGSVAVLLNHLREAGAGEQVAALLARDPAAHVALNNPDAVAMLLGSLQKAGADEQVAALLARDPAAHVALNDPDAVASLLDELHKAGADEQVARLLARDPAAHVALNDPYKVARLRDSLQDLGAHGGAAALARRAAAHADRAAFDDPDAVAMLLKRLRAAGADEQVAALLARDPAAHVALNNPDAVARLLGSLREAGAGEQVAALLARDPAAHVALNDPDAVVSLLDELQWGGAEVSLLDSLQWGGVDEQAAALATRAAAHVALDNPWAVTLLLERLNLAGADEQAAALLARDPAAHVAFDNPYAVARLLRSLREAGAGEQVAALLARDPAARLALDDPDVVASLLGSLQNAGAEEQVAALLARDPAAHVALNDPDAVASLLDELHKAGADEQAAALADRLPAAGMFALFLEWKGVADEFHFGREADGTPTAPWAWEDLDLWLFLNCGDRRHRHSAEQTAQIPVGGAETEEMTRTTAPLTVQGDSSKPS